MPLFNITDVSKGGGTANAGGSIVDRALGGFSGIVNAQGVGLQFGQDKSRVFVMDEGNVAIVDNPGDGVAAIMRIVDRNGMAPTDRGGALSDLTGGLFSADSGLLGIGASGPVMIKTHNSSQGVNFSVQYALGNMIFLQAFGDKLTQISVSGIALKADCPTTKVALSGGLGSAIGGSLSVTTGVPGLTQVVQYYNENRLRALTADEGNPGALPEVSIAWFDGTTSFKGYIVGCTHAIPDPRTYAVPFQFDLVGVYDTPSRGLIGNLINKGLGGIGFTGGTSGLGRRVASILP